ncbi:hypothetical protein BASA81_006727 [Batrachochytrium salamandrivorans]|nr:hypothetical protein BASA81_006727 [Batrachochytrium salamandrivorans]
MEYTVDALKELSRRELQQLAKDLGVKANQRSFNLISQISQLDQNRLPPPPVAPVPAESGTCSQTLPRTVPSTPLRPAVPVKPRKSAFQEQLIAERRRRRQSLAGNNGIAVATAGEDGNNRNLWERIESTSKPGMFYFYNPHTNETSWELKPSSSRV